MEDATAAVAVEGDVPLDFSSRWVWSPPASEQQTAGGGDAGASGRGCGEASTRRSSQACDAASRGDELGTAAPGGAHGRARRARATVSRMHPAKALDVLWPGERQHTDVLAVRSDAWTARRGGPD